jgi:DNA-binding NarL/FixJ family response regulator
MSMARMSGIQAAPMLKKLLPGLPIILFTSHYSAIKGFEGQLIGIDAVLPKDGDLSNLLANVEALMHKHPACDVSRT